MAETDDTPKDKNWCVYISIFLLGISVLMPWKFYINETDYWNYKLRNISDGSGKEMTTKDTLNNAMNRHAPAIYGLTLDSNETKDGGLTQLQLYWNSYLSIANAVPTAITLVINAFYGHRIPLKPRIVTALVTTVVLLVITDIFSKVNTDSFQNEFMSITIATLVLLSISKGVLQGGLIGLAGQFPPSYMGAYFKGQSMGELITTVVYIAILAALGNGDFAQSRSAFYCFLVSSIAITLEIFIFLLVSGTDFYKHFTKTRKAEGDGQKNVEQGKENSIGPSDISIPKSNQFDETLQNEHKKQEGILMNLNESQGINYNKTEQASDPNIMLHEDLSLDGVGNLDHIPLMSSQMHHNEMSTIDIVKKIWIWLASIFLNFAVCLSVFPSIATLVVSTERGTGNEWSDVYFTPVGCFLLFHVGDFIGRAMASRIQWPRSTTRGSYVVLAVSIAKIGLIPMFIFCNASPLNRKLTSVYFHSDAIFLSLMGILSVSTGYIGTIALMFGPKMLDQDNRKDQGRAASIIALFLASGLTTGALLSASFIKLL